MAKWQNECIERNENQDVGLYVGLNVFVILYCVALTAASLFFLYRFYQRREEKGIDLRHPYLTIIIVLLSTPMTLVFTPLGVDFYTIECESNVSVLRNKGKDKSPTKRLEEFILITSVMALFAWAFAIVIRVWLLRYEYERSRAIRASEWKKILGVAQLTADWYTHNRSTYGNGLWLAQRLAAPYLLSLALFIVVSPVMKYMKDDWVPFTVVVGIFTLATLGVIVMLVWKIRSIHDTLEIKNEIMMLAKVSVAFVAWQLLVYIVGRVSGRVLWNWTVFMFGISVQWVFFGISYVQTGWVLRTFDRRKTLQQRLSENVSPTADAEMGLQHVVCHQDGFEVFMEFLVTEFSTENLLCYVELTQFLNKWRVVLKRLIRQEICEARDITMEQYEEEMANKQVQTRARQKSGQDVLKRIGQNIAENLGRAAEAMVVHAHATSQGEFKDRYDEPDNPEEDEELLGRALDQDMVNKFRFLPVGKIVDSDCSIFEHTKFLENRYIRPNSQLQVNIKSSLYRKWTRVEKEDCDIMAWKSVHDSVAKSMSIIQQKSEDAETDLPDKAGSQGEIQFTSSLSQTSNTSNPSRKRRKPQGVFKTLRLIEDTRCDLWKLMQDSFLRFRTSEEYVAFAERFRRATRANSLVEKKPREKDQ